LAPREIERAAASLIEPVASGYAKDDLAAIVEAVRTSA
jgi:hypothetical protein